MSRTAKLLRLLALAACFGATVGAAQPQSPHLRRQGSATQLIVDGQPFLIIGGELHNSSSSNLEYMRPIWQRMLDLNFNTVLAAVSWELIEPEEGEFDFRLVDGLIEDARRHKLRLVLLWFGSWKNGQSSYIPTWVKKNYKRFPRVKIKEGESVEVLSTLSDANRDADARAFAALMRHLREVDGRDQTVIMMQVENEVGVLGDSRDRCDPANEAFAGPVPGELIEYLRKNRDNLLPEIRKMWASTGFRTAGSWEEVFGAGLSTDEAFMAWNYATYIERVAAAGKAEYPLPMYVNAWLSGPNRKPGNWPSGGPLPHVMDIWKAGAPSVDVLAPDIYASNFAEWCEWYTQLGNPLFIPETRRSGANPFYAFGQYDAIGVSPFAVDSIANPGDSELAKSYGILRQIAPLILEHQGKGEMAGFLLDEKTPSRKVELGDYELEVSLDAVFSYKAKRGYGLIMSVGGGEFIGAGTGLRVAFSPKTPGPPLVGVAAVDEGTFSGGKWVPGRRLNGDETDQGRRWRLSSRYGGTEATIQRCSVYRYE